MNITAKNNFKKDRYEERILVELNGQLRKDLSDSRLQFMTFTKVELNPDFSDAVVYWDTFDPDKKPDIDSALQAVMGKMRSMLAQKIQVRHTPTLVFKYDSQYEAEKAITEILDNEKAKHQED